MIEKKLQNGDNLLRNAGHDKQQYGFALVAYHGAIEDLFRQKLASEIAEFEQSGSRAGWMVLINLWQKKYGLSHYERKTILDHNTIRQPIGHGDPVEVERSLVEAYGNFVKNFIRQNSSSERAYTIPSPPQSRKVRPAAVPTTPTHSIHTPNTKKSASCLKRLVIAIFLLGLIMVGYVWMTLATLDNATTLDGRTELDVILDNSEENDSSLVEEEDSSLNKRETTTPRPASSNTAGNENKIRIRVVQGNSNVRAEPGEEFDIVGIAPNNEEYEVLETSPNQNWFKIELDSGEVGWVGSTRVITISP